MHWKQGTNNAAMYQSTWDKALYLQLLFTSCDYLFVINCLWPIVQNYLKWNHIALISLLSLKYFYFSLNKG